MRTVKFAPGHGWTSIVRIDDTWAPTRLFVPLVHLEASVRSEPVYLAVVAEQSDEPVLVEEYAAHALWGPL